MQGNFYCRTVEHSIVELLQMDGVAIFKSMPQVALSFLEPYLTEHPAESLAELLEASLTLVQAATFLSTPGNP